MPDVGLSGSAFNTPGSPSESIGAIDSNFQWVDHLSMTKGRNQIKVGIDFIHEKFYQVTDFGGIPGVSFPRHQFSGVGLGDFLLGDPYSARASIGDSSQDLRSNYYGGFFQDDWHVGRSLTLNLGLRYEFQQTPYDTSSKTAWFDPSVQDVVYSRSGKVRNGIVDPDYNNFAPRVGFAWSPLHSRTVIRGGAGTFYGTDNWNELQFLVYAPDFESTQNLQSDPNKPTLTMGELFPQASLGGGTSVPFSVRQDKPHGVRQRVESGHSTHLHAQIGFLMWDTLATWARSLRNAGTRHGHFRSDRHDSSFPTRTISAVQFHPRNLQRRLVEL